MKNQSKFKPGTFVKDKFYNSVAYDNSGEFGVVIRRTKNSQYAVDVFWLECSEIYSIYPDELIEVKPK